MITGTRGDLIRAVRTNSRPSISGITRSLITTSGAIFRWPPALPAVGGEKLSNGGVFFQQPADQRAIHVRVVDHQDLDSGCKLGHRKSYPPI